MEEEVPPSSEEPNYLELAQAGSCICPEMEALDSTQAPDAMAPRQVRMNRLRERDYRCHAQGMRRAGRVEDHTCRRKSRVARGAAK